MNEPNKILVVVSISFSLFFALFALELFSDMQQGPYFVDTSLIKSRYEPLHAVDVSIGQMEADVQKGMARFDDSLSKLMDSLANGNRKDGELLELLNMESNVARHKMLDSVRIIADMKIREAYGYLDRDIAGYCKRYGVEVLFGTASNTIVYGSGGKSDLTPGLLRYMGGIVE